MQATQLVRQARQITPPEVRFWAKIQRGADNECWPWTAGCTAQGYGGFHPTKTRMVLAHRYAYELTYGPVPEGLHVDHTCHNGTECQPGPKCPHRKCCNPRHLDPTEPVANVQRSHNANHRKTHCPKNHPYTPENTYWQQPRKPGNRPLRKCRQCQCERDRARPPRRTRSN